MVDPVTEGTETRGPKLTEFRVRNLRSAIYRFSDYEVPYDMRLRLDQLDNELSMWEQVGGGE